MVGYVFRARWASNCRACPARWPAAAQPVDRSALTPGDLVFFGVHGQRVDHVGIYVGEGRFLHAPRTGRDVTVSQPGSGYWSGKYLQARRVAGSEPPIAIRCTERPLPSGLFAFRRRDSAPPSARCPCSAPSPGSRIRTRACRPRSTGTQAGTALGLPSIPSSATNTITQCVHSRSSAGPASGRTRSRRPRNACCWCRCRPAWPTP